MTRGGASLSQNDTANDSHAMPRGRCLGNGSKNTNGGGRATTTTNGSKRVNGGGRNTTGGRGRVATTSGVTQKPPNARPSQQQLARPDRSPANAMWTRDALNFLPLRSM